MCEDNWGLHFQIIVIKIELFTQMWCNLARCRFWPDPLWRTEARMPYLWWKKISTVDFFSSTPLVFLVQGSRWCREHKTCIIHSPFTTCRFNFRHFPSHLYYHPVVKNNGEDYWILILQTFIELFRLYTVIIIVSLANIVIKLFTKH